MQPINQRNFHFALRRINPEIEISNKIAFPNEIWERENERTRKTGENVINKFIKILTIILITLFITNCTQTPDWENPQVINKNRLDPHTGHIPFHNEDYSMTLNGTWKFNVVKNPSLRSMDFWKNDFDTKDWADIKVPGHWELQGFGTPIYTDEEYPFTPDPPHVPKDFNPVGSYVRHFDIPDKWLEKKIFLNFGSIRSAMYLWINDHKVGYCQGSKTPAEFDITDYVKPKNNKISLQIFRFSDGSYLEGQDYWKVSGLERDVFLKMFRFGIIM